MRGRQQYYLTIGCAPNWPGLALPPRRDMPILRGQDWAHWDYVQPSNGLRGMSWGGVEQCGACPFFAGGTAEPERWVLLGDYVHASCRLRGMSSGGVGQRGACPFFAGWAGRIGIMSMPRAGCGACPVAGMGSVGHAHFSRSGLGYLGLCPARASRRGHVPRKSPRPGGEGPIGRSWKVQVF